MNPSGSTATTYRIELPAPTVQEASVLRESSKDRPHPTGFGREIPSERQAIRLSDLAWQRNEAGEYLSAISVRSTGAKSIRVGLQVEGTPSDLRIAFNDKNVVPASVVGAIAPDLYWSPVTQGDVATLELRSARRPENVTLRILRVSHIP